MAKNYIATTKPIKIESADHAAWLENRKAGIGSSEVASIVGLNPYESKYQLWLRKTGQTPAKEETFFMKAGHYLEDAVARFFEDESGYTIIKRSASEDIYVHPDYEWARVSPDRAFWLSDTHNDDKGILECKTTQREIDPDNIPPYWFTQVQYQLGVMGRKKAAIAWLSAGRVFDYREIEFVPDYFNWLMEQVEEFYTKNVLGGEEPELTTVEDVLNKYPISSATFVEASPEISGIISSLKEKKETKKILEEEIGELEDKIKLAIGEAESLNYQGSVLCTWKSAKDGKKFDEKAFKAENPELWDKYVKTVPGSRRFLVK